MNIRMFMIGISVILLLVGCQNPMNQQGQSPNRDQSFQPTRHGEDRQNTDRNEQRTTERGTTDRRTTDRRTTERRDGQETRNQRDHNRYDVAEEAAERITSELNEIDQAYVLTTNNNAYVAVVFDDDRGDRDKTKTRSNRGRTDKDTDRNRARVDEDRRGKADNDLSDRTFIGHDDDISDHVKSDIADIVRSVDRDIDNVYVSTNPDFVDLTNSYIDDVNAGHPIRGFFDEMGDMIQRIFPQNR